MNSSPIKTAVVTGAHSFDVMDFHHLFRGLDGVDAYIQHMDDFSSAPQEVRDSYDAVVMYIFLREGPLDEEEPKPHFPIQPKEAMEHLGDTEQGIVVLHHGILAYPKWALWDEIVGIEERSYGASWLGVDFDQSLRIEVADKKHPITEGIASWEMIDETYTMADAKEGSDILLTTAHPKSMKTIGWVRKHKKARVFCFQSGHDNQTWQAAGFREVLQRGIHWVSRRI